MTGWIDRFLAAIGLGGRKAEADVSQDPAQRGPRQSPGTVGEAVSQQYVGRPGPDAEDTGAAAELDGP
jgi:hypothetical protein